MCFSFVSLITVSNKDKTPSISLASTGSVILFCTLLYWYHVPFHPSFTVSVHQHPSLLKQYNSFLKEDSKKYFVDLYKVLIRTTQKYYTENVFIVIKCLGILKFTIKFVCIYLVSNGTKFHKLN